LLGLSYPIFAAISVILSDESLSYNAGKNFISCNDTFSGAVFHFVDAAAVFSDKFFELLGQKNPYIVFQPS